MFVCYFPKKEKKAITCDSFQAKIQTIQGHARFTSDPQPTVEVNGKKYTAPHILIATGGQPSVLSDDEVPGKTCCSQVILSVFGSVESEQFIIFNLLIK